MSFDLVKFRTVGVAVSAQVALVAGLAICARWPAAVPAYSFFAAGMAGIVASSAYKSAREHQANAK